MMVAVVIGCFILGGIFGATITLVCVAVSELSEDFEDDYN